MSIRNVWKVYGLAVALVAIPAGIALAGNDVVVDGETKYFDSSAVIDNLDVKNGGIVWLEGTTVKGNVTIEGTDSYAGSNNGCTINGNAIVKDGGRLSMWQSTIAGNLQGDGAGHINFLLSEVGGNVQLTGGADFNGSQGGTVDGDFKYEKGSAVWLYNWTVGGNVQVSDNAGRDIFIASCEIDGDLQVCKNSMGPSWWTWYPIEIKGNTVGGNLQVKENDSDPAPRVIDNDVTGDEDVD